MEAPEPPPPAFLTSLTRFAHVLTFDWVPVAPNFVFAVVRYNPISPGPWSGGAGGGPPCTLSGLGANVEYEIAIDEYEEREVCHSTGGGHHGDGDGGQSCHLEYIRHPRPPFRVYTRPKWEIRIERFVCEATEYGIRILWDIPMSELEPIGNSDKLRIMVEKQQPDGSYDYLGTLDYHTAPKFPLGRNYLFDWTRQLRNTYALRLVAIDEFPAPYELNQSEKHGPERSIDLNCTFDHMIPHEGIKGWRLPTAGNIMGNIGRY